MDLNLNDELDFVKNKYKVIHNFIEKDFVYFIQDYYSLKINSNSNDIDSSKFSYGYKFYSDHLMETVLQNSCDTISEIIKENLFPTCSLTNFYMKGDSFINVKKPSYEISAILSLGNSNDFKSSPIFLSKNKNSSNLIEINLNPGDLLIYKNLDLLCWREPIQHKWVLESILNFVISDGPNKTNIYDERPYLGFNKQTENTIGEN